MQHCTDFIHLFIHTPASRLKPNTYSASSHHMIIWETVKEIYKKEKNKIVALMKKKTNKPLNLLWLLSFTTILKGCSSNNINPWIRFFYSRTDLVFLINNGEIVKISLFAVMKTGKVIVCHSLCERGIKMLERLSKSWQAYRRNLTLALFLIHVL